MELMAERIVFLSTLETKPAYEERMIPFTYYSGFSLSQKQNSISSMHDSIKKLYPEKNCLEVSTKSNRDIGVKLSAFNLKSHDMTTDLLIPIENIFQSSKVFQNGGPYSDLLFCSPKEAKTDERLKNSGDLIYFQYCGERWPLVPKSMFYDWIYLTAINQNEDLIDSMITFNAFSDIEFNHKKSINCQARAAAIFVSLYHSGHLNVLDNIQTFSEVYPVQQPIHQQNFYDHSVFCQND
jgi:type I restriction enzyme M protein